MNLKDKPLDPMHSVFYVSFRFGDNTARKIRPIGANAIVVIPLYAGLLTLLFLILSWRVIQFRQRGIPLGDGGDPKMLRLIRGHGNFAEYVPMILVMMGCLEIGRTSVYALHALGITLLASRSLHGYALSFTDRFRFGRTWGAGLTFAVLAATGVLCLLQAIRGMAVT